MGLIFLKDKYQPWLDTQESGIGGSLKKVIP